MRKLARTFVPGSKRAGPFRSREQKFQGAKWPESETAGDRIGQVRIGRFAPGSEWAREQKGLVPKQYIANFSVVSRSLCILILNL